MFNIFSRQKIPCYVLIYDQLEIIKKALESLVKHADKLEIVVIENPSAQTADIEALVNSYGQAGKIRRYYQFKENITGMAYDMVLNEEIKQFSETPFVVVTDGDLTCPTDWVGEEVNILNNNKDVFACGVTLDKANLPIKAFPESVNWIPADQAAYPDYFEARTGGHMLMFRGRDLASFLYWKAKNQRLFLDSHMHEYCYEVRKMKWARTSKSVAWHITWDLYQDKKHPYTKSKTAKTFDQIWRHQKTSEYKLTKY